MTPSAWRQELFCKSAQQTKDLIHFLAAQRFSGLNIPNKAKGELPSLLDSARSIHAALPNADLCIHYSITANYHRAAEASFATLVDFCRQLSAIERCTLLLVSGGGPRKRLDSLRALQLMGESQECRQQQLPLAVAFNPYFPDSQRQQEERQRLRLKLLAGQGRVVAIYLQAGSDVQRLREGLAFLEQLLTEFELNVCVCGNMWPNVQPERQHQQEQQQCHHQQQQQQQQPEMNPPVTRELQQGLPQPAVTQQAAKRQRRSPRPHTLDSSAAEHAVQSRPSTSRGDGQKDMQADALSNQQRQQDQRQAHRGPQGQHDPHQGQQGSQGQQQQQQHVQVYGSVLVPSRKLLAAMKFRPWRGVFLSEEYLSSVEAADEVTRQILAVYAEHSVTPLVETEVTTAAESERVRQLLQGALA